MNYEVLLDTIMQRNTDVYDYYKLSKAYIKEHGHGLNIDRAKTDKERRIAYLSRETWFEDGGIDTCMDLLGYEREQRLMAYKAARALERWYAKTDWQRCPSRDLIDRLQRYVEG